MPLRDLIERGLYLGFIGLIASAFAARFIRQRWSWSPQVRITYASGQTVVVPHGFSVLEASRSAGIPHVSVCGGRGRCSTCRVRVLEGVEGQPTPTLQEQSTLQRIKAADDVRLACQLRPLHNLTVAPILVRRSPEPSGKPKSLSCGARNRHHCIFLRPAGFYLLERATPSLRRHVHSQSIFRGGWSRC